MGTDLVPAPGGEIARAQQPNDIDSLIAMVVQKGDQNVADTLEKMFAFKLRVQAHDAEAAFNQDFAAALLEMPKVKKSGKIEMGAKGEMSFAKYEDIDAAIRPIEARFGFARSFSTRPCENGVEMTLTLKHRGGHSETSTLFMPPDSGAGRNGMQARGSASSYAKRYLTLDKWNIVTEKDNDGATAEPISQEQADTINSLISEIGMDAKRKAKFLEMAHAKSVSQIQRNVYDFCVVFLDQARRAAAK